MSNYKKVLSAFRNRYVLNSLLENALYMIGSLALFFLIFSFLTSHLTTSFEYYDALKTWSLVAKIFTGILLILFIIRFLFSIPGIKKIAQTISEHNPKDNEIILSAYEFEESADLSHYSREILDKAIGDADHRASELNYSTIFPASNLKKSVQSIFFVVITFVLVLLINPVLLTTSIRMILHPTSFAPHYDSYILVEPGNTKILKGSNLPIIIKNYYPELSYEIRIEQEKRWKTVSPVSYTHLRAHET